MHGIAPSYSGTRENRRAKTKSSLPGSPELKRGSNRLREPSGYFETDIPARKM
jgi:hypothetical protein